MPNADSISAPSINDSGLNTTTIGVAHGSRFRAGDLLSPTGSRETLLVTAVNSNGTLTLQRGYGGSTKSALIDTQELKIIANATLEGAEAADARFTVRSRVGNYTQIFAATVQVSGSEAAARQLAIANEIDYQKACRLRELLRDLENTLLNGVANETAPQGSTTVRRSMRGILASLSTHVFTPGQGIMPGDAELSEATLNLALRQIWERTGSQIDLVVVGGLQKRRINGFLNETARVQPLTNTYRNMLSYYESDFGVCRVVLSRHLPTDAVLLLDTSRLSVLPLSGRSFHYQPLAVTGDYTAGEQSFIIYPLYDFAMLACVFIGTRRPNGGHLAGTKAFVEFRRRVSVPPTITPSAPRAYLCHGSCRQTNRLMSQSIKVLRFLGYLPTPCMRLVGRVGWTGRPLHCRIASMSLRISTWARNIRPSSTPPRPNT